MGVLRIATWNISCGIPAEWMNPVDIADLMMYILKLPKIIEVSEITINRKVV